MQNLEEIVHLNPDSHSNSENKFLDQTREEKNDYQALETFTQNAIDAAGFGRFNIQVTLLSAFVYVNTAISLTSNGFILPAAACDFEMKTIDKGRIPIVFLLGLTIGTIIWGFVIDLKGRKYALTFCLYLQGSSEFLMSLISNYWCFLCLKLLSGMGVSGQMMLVFTYTSEFQPTKFRKRILSWLDIAWICGLFLVPLIAWIIIPLKLEYVVKNFSFRSWNLFILICSLPGLIIGISLHFFPETPKFLANSKQYTKLLKVLAVMYEQNTGKSAKDYFLLLEEENNLVFNKAICAVFNDENLPSKEPEEKKHFKMMLEDLKSQAEEIFKTHYFKKMITGSAATFMILSPYNTLILWFPELLERFAKFEHQYPNESSSVCIVSQRFNSTLNTDPINCDRSIHNGVFTDTLWLSASCIPPAILLPLFVDKLGFKFFLVSATIASSFATLGLFFVRSSLQNIILSCVFESTNSIGITIIYCCLVEIFPTNFRILAVSVVLLSGRMGCLVGNLIFSYFIDNYCAPVIISVATQLFLGAILCYIL